MDLLFGRSPTVEVGVAVGAAVGAEVRAAEMATHIGGKTLGLPKEKLYTGSGKQAAAGSFQRWRE